MTQKLHKLLKDQTTQIVPKEEIFGGNNYLEEF